MSAALEIDDVRARVQELPALPNAIHEISAALSNEDLNLDEFASKIAIDPALVSKILRAANSPFYGMSGSIGSVNEAVRVIGLRTVSSLLTAAAISGRIEAPVCPGFDFRAFWSHSLVTAICAQELARECATAQNLAFTTGLLHDIGRLALASYYPRSYAGMYVAAHARDCSLLEAERAVVGITHTEIGAEIAAHWKFAEPIIDAIRSHHEPDTASVPDEPTVTDIVHAADGIAHALELAEEGEELVPPLDLDSWERLPIAPQKYLRVFRRTEQSYEGMRHALGL